MILPPSKPPPPPEGQVAADAAEEREAPSPESGSTSAAPTSGPRLPPPVSPPVRPSGSAPARPPLPTPNTPPRAFAPSPAPPSSQPRLQPAPEAVFNTPPLEGFGQIDAIDEILTPSRPGDALLDDEEEEDDEPTVMSVRPKAVKGPGGALPALVFVHSFGLDYRMWRQQVSGLTERFRILTLDLPGFGPQARARGEVTPAFEIARALDVCGLVKAHFVGAAEGATAVLDFALRHPRRVESLILQGPMLPGHEVRGDAWERAVNLAKEGDKTTAVEMWLDSPLFDGARVDDSLFDELRQIALDYTCAHWLDQVKDCYLEADPSLRLSELDMPAMVVSGQHDAPELLALAADLAKKMPRAAHKIVNGVGHLPNFEAPDAFNFLVTHFVAEDAPQSRNSVPPRK